MSEDRLKRFCEAVRSNVKNCLNNVERALNIAMPPVLSLNDCPPISVLTLTYNRRNFIDLAFINMLQTDYPTSKIQWVIVDDSDDPALSVSDKIRAFENREPGFEITYVPLNKKRNIGYKRNKAVEAAKHDICVNMDDDDVYPVTSFRRRVGWLLSKKAAKVAGCTMIAMYDLQQGISAVNTPPWALAQSQRVSEASFCFWKDYALEHPFPDAAMSEGEGFVPKGEAFLEIPPQQILVALNHGKNTSTRVIAGRAQTGCFWGWDKQFIKWLHGLIGVQVEEEGAA
jgi:glycosyltransferase involved in cell wall biosynthesis